MPVLEHCHLAVSRMSVRAISYAVDTTDERVAPIVKKLPAIPPG